MVASWWSLHETQEHTMANSPGEFMAASPAPKGGGGGGQQRLVLLALTIVVGVVFGFVAGVSFAAWVGGTVGEVVGLVLGLALGWVLPLVLSVRASRALTRQRRPVLLRRVVALFLVVVTQLTLLLLGLDNAGSDKVSASAAMAKAALPLLRPVPMLGGVLENYAVEGGAADLPSEQEKTDGVAQPTDGTASSATASSSSASPSPAHTGLSPRAAGRTIGTLAAIATTTEGGLVLVRVGVAFGGQTSLEPVDLSAFADKGAPTRADESVDGHAVVVLAGQHVIVVAPKKAPALDAGLSKGGKLGELELQTIRDIAIGPGGALLAAVDAFDVKKGAVVQALVARPVGGAAFVVRRAGTPIEGEKLVAGEAPDVSFGYSIKRHEGTGHVVVEEVILEDDTAVNTKLDGAVYAMNPRRLLVGTIDSPRALAELVRTGDAPSGIEKVSLQGFADAVALPDGRVIFDANFVEEGARGWLFSARLGGGGAFAVAPELVGKPEAPFAERAPRTPHLTVEPEGGFGFVTRDGALMLGALQRLAESKPALLRADVVSKTGKVGGVSRVLAARLLPGAEWVLASIELLEESGQRREALVLASRADLGVGKAELLLIDGGVVPAPASAAASSSRVKSLFVLEGHDEPLWGAAAP
jgi:hypothetical protein